MDFPRWISVCDSGASSGFGALIEESASDPIALRRTLRRAWITLQRVECQGGDGQARRAGVHGSTIARLWKRHGERDSSVTEEERGKRGQESNHGVLATRKPMRLIEPSGVLLWRDEERTMSETSPFQEPPRTTRTVPDTGPSGFVDGLTE